MKPKRKLAQSRIERFLKEDVREEKKEDFKVRLKKWRENYGNRYYELLIQQEKCLDKREYLFLIKEYKLFTVG
jgi:hypothetical protein